MVPFILANKLVTYSQDEAYAANGNVPRYALHSLSSSSQINATPSMVWSTGGPFPYLAQRAASRVRVKAGGHLVDAATGVGLRTFAVQGIVDGTPYEEILTTAGLLASAYTTALFQRVFSVRVISSGSARANVGDVILEDETAAVLGTIKAGRAILENGFYTVPTGFRLRLNTVQISVKRSTVHTGVQVVAYSREDAFGRRGHTSPKRLFFETFSGDVARPLTFNYDFPLVFEEETDIWFEATGGRGGRSVTCAIQALLEKVD